MLNSSIRLVFIALACASLVACGSSSGGNSGSINVAPSDPSSPTGKDPKRPTIGYDGDEILSFEKDTVSLDDSNALINDILLLQFGDTVSSTLVSHLPSTKLPIEQQVKERDHKSIAALHVQGELEQDQITGTLEIYKQAHSSIIFSHIDKVEGRFKQNFDKNSTHLTQILGEATVKVPDLAASTITYTGSAFYKDEVGTLNFSANFRDLSGEGQINIASLGLIELKGPNPGEQNIVSNAVIGNGAYQGLGISQGKVEIGGVEDKSRYYELLFYGEQAQELVGRVAHDSNDIIFGGKRP